MRTMALFSCVCALATACMSPESVESDVRARIDHLIEASNRRDLDAAVDSYCQDAVLHPPGGEEVRGRDAIRARYASLYDNWQPSLSVEHSSTSLARDSATDHGFIHGRLEPVTPGEDRILEDAYEAVLHCDDGVWRVHELFWRPRATVRAQ